MNSTSHVKDVESVGRPDPIHPTFTFSTSEIHFLAYLADPGPSPKLDARSLQFSEDSESFNSLKSRDDGDSRLSSSSSPFFFPFYAPAFTPPLPSFTFRDILDPVLHSLGGNSHLNSFIRSSFETRPHRSMSSPPRLLFPSSTAHRINK